MAKSVKQSHRQHLMLDPVEGETARDYVERIEGAGRSVDVQFVDRHYGLPEGTGKALAIASVHFNARFSYDQWARRRARSIDGYGPRHFLQKKYKLEDQEADDIVAAFETGNQLALVDHLQFDGLAQRLLTKHFQIVLEEQGFLETERRD